MHEMLSRSGSSYSEQAVRSFVIRGVGGDETMAAWNVDDLYVRVSLR